MKKTVLLAVGLLFGISMYATDNLENTTSTETISTQTEENLDVTETTLEDAEEVAPER